MGPKACWSSIRWWGGWGEGPAVAISGLVALEVGHRQELGKGCVDAGDHSTNGLVIVEAAVVSVVPKHVRVEK